jgi:ribose-phosphate pyrophosphokinase
LSDCVLQCLPSAAREARQLAGRLDLVMNTVAVHRFPDDELRVTVGQAAPTTILYTPLDRPNDKLLSVLFASEALRRGGAKRLVLVAPYLCYMRQDIAFHTGEAISQKVVGHLLAEAFDRIVTVDAHLHRTKRIEEVFPGAEAQDLTAMPAIYETLRFSGVDPATVVVGPDGESEQWVAELARLLGTAHMVAKKVRRGDHVVEVVFPDPKLLAGRPVLLVDDIVSSGATLIACARALLAAGCKTIDAVVTHALFPPEMIRKFHEVGIRSIRSTTSVPHPSNAIALDEVLGEALLNEVGLTELPRPPR